jgi:hypothetical protein
MCCLSWRSEWTRVSCHVCIDVKVFRNCVKVYKCECALCFYSIKAKQSPPYPPSPNISCRLPCLSHLQMVESSCQEERLWCCNSINMDLRKIGYKVGKWKGLRIVPITGIAISTVEPLCFTDRGLAYGAHVCWQALVLPQLNLWVMWTVLVFILTLVPCILYFVQLPTNAQLTKLLYCSYMFWHYCVILWELVVSRVHTGPVQRQHHHHTDCVYCHHTGLHENWTTKLILAILL